MNTPVRRRCRYTTLVLALAAGAALAQPAPPPPPLEPVPEIPPPPGVVDDADLEPAVTIRRAGDGEVREEARVNGEIRWVRVTPRNGRPYFLVPDQGGNTYIRRDSLDTGLKVPLWLLYSF
jgi:hypothetical protein